MGILSSAEAYKILHESVGVADLSSEDIFEVTGADRVDFLNNYNSQDIKKMPEDSFARGTFQTQKGKLVADAWILKLKDKILLLFAAGFGAKVRKHLDLYLNFAETELTDVSDQWGHLAALGPASIELMKSVSNHSDLQEKNTVYHISMQGQSVLAFASTRFGIVGWDLLCPRESADLLNEALLKGGAVPVHQDDLELTRVEAGLPKMGVDMGEDHLVAEVGLDRDAVSFNKGCYLGQETTARVQTQGHVNRRLVRLRLKKPFHGPLPLEVYQGEGKVGEITSLVDSIRWKAPLALGILRSKALKSDRVMTIQTPESKIEVELVEP